MATHSSILSWRISWTEEPGGLQSIRLQRVRQDWSNLACSTQWRQRGKSSWYKIGRIWWADWIYGRIWPRESPDLSNAVPASLVTRFGPQLPTAQQPPSYPPPPLTRALYMLCSFTLHYCWQSLPFFLCPEKYPLNALPHSLHLSKSHM